MRKYVLAAVCAIGLMIASLLTARLSGHQVMINGHALSPPLSFVAAIPAGPEPRSRWSACSEARTNNPDGRRSFDEATTVTECG